MPPTLLVLARGVISFATLLILARLLGKQQLGQLSFFEYITGITIGSMASSLTVDLNTRAWLHWVGLCTWAALTFAVQSAALRSRRVAAALAGEPEVIVSRGRILEGNMRRNRYRYEDLFAHLRQQGIFDLHQVEFAVLETTGELSVLQRSPGKVARHLPLLLVQEGEILRDNLKVAGRDEPWLIGELQNRGVASVAEVTVAVLSPEDDLYVDTHDDPPPRTP